MKLSRFITQKWRSEHEAHWSYTSPLTIDEQRMLIEKIESIDWNDRIPRDPLEEKDILTEKAEIYGEPEIAMRHIGMIWGAILSQWNWAYSAPISPPIVSLMLIGMKLARLGRTPEHEDSMKDAHGYLDIVKLCNDCE